MELRKALSENWPIKLASLLLAVTLWFYVTSKGQTELSLTVPLELRNVPQGMAVVGDIAAVVEIRLQGQERPLRDVASSRKVLVAVDLSRARLGENRIHLSADDVRRPSGVAVTYLAPAEISVRLERLMRRTVRLKAVIQGSPAPGYRFAGVTVTPPSITVEGPAGIIESFSRLQTMPIDITGMTEPLTLEPRIDFRGRTVKVITQGISVTITIRKERS
jgi:YbbR domain-containing protein